MSEAAIYRYQQVKLINQKVGSQLAEYLKLKIVSENIVLNDGTSIALDVAGRDIRQLVELNPVPGQAHTIDENKDG